MSEDTAPIIDGWVKVMIVILVIAAIIEVAVLVLAYVKADKVNCNWLWCDFQTTRGSSVISEECYSNGIKINCSGMKEFLNMTGLEKKYGME